MVYGFILPTLMVKSYNQYMVNIYIITMEIHIFSLNNISSII